MPRTVPFLAVLLTLSLGQVAQADHCETWQTSGANVAVGPMYVIMEGLGSPCCFTLGVYEETNGIEGLQRQEPWGPDDTCHGQIRPDTWIEGIWIP